MQVGNICRPTGFVAPGGVFTGAPAKCMRNVAHAIKSLLLRDTAATFIGAALVSSYLTVLGLAYHATDGFSPPQAPQPVLRSSPIDLTKSFKDQVSFVSSIIKSHAPKLKSHEQLAALIVQESARASIDPLFVAAVIRSESMFTSSALSNRGAQGLMQLMPATADYVSKLENIRLKGGSLNDPSTNIRLGVAYLKYLEKRFGGDRERVLIAYNWGPANLSQSLRNRRAPPRQTVTYAREILRQHSSWKRSMQEVAYNAAPLASIRAMVG